MQNEATVSGKEKSGKPVASEPIEGEGHVPEDQTPEDLAARLKEVEGVSDDAAIFLAENWSKFLGFVCLVILGTFVYNSWKTSSMSRMHEASDRFAQVQQRLKEVGFIATDSEDGKKEAEKNTKAIFDSIDVLKSSHSDTSYGDLAELYQAKALLELGKTKEAQELLAKTSSMDASSGLGISSLKTELASLLNAKSWLMGANPDISKARTLLIETANNSDVVGGEAIVSLLRLAKTPEQRSQVLDVAKKVLERKPEYRTQLERSFALLGMELPE